MAMTAAAAGREVPGAGAACKVYDGSGVATMEEGDKGRRSRARYIK